MERYLGVKIVFAEKMNMDEAEKTLNRPLDSLEKDGYIVQYEIDGYKSWSPKTTFEKSYRKINKLNFGLAIEALKEGKRVARSGWNGKGMFLFLVKPTEIEYKNSLPAQYAEAEHLESITMKTADNKILVGWLASQTDMLAEDWEIVE